MYKKDCRPVSQHFHAEFIFCDLMQSIFMHIYGRVLVQYVKVMRQNQGMMIFTKWPYLKVFSKMEIDGRFNVWLSAVLSNCHKLQSFNTQVLQLKMSQMQHCIDTDVIDGDIPELNGQVLFWWGVGVSNWLAIKIDLLNPS